MRFLITGELGFIGRNLRRTLESRGHFVVNTVWDRGAEHQQPFPFRITQGWHTETDTLKVPCVHRNDGKWWASVFDKCQVDVVIHNAAVVGTDVVALHPERATLSNVLGTQNICEGAKMSSGTKVCYMGTTVVYDCNRYQDRLIHEDDVKRPSTYYGHLKLTGENIVQELGDCANVVRPLFAYGGLGDMNSLIAKTLFAHLKGRDTFDVFLDPLKGKDYMHVDDFCEAVSLVCEKGCWGDDFNVAADHRNPTGAVVHSIDLVVSDRGLVGQQGFGRLPSSRVKWHPETDYLGNHFLSSQKVKNATGWFSRTSLRDGIIRSLESILENQGDNYNPMKYLDEAASRGVSLLDEFPS